LKGATEQKKKRTELPGHAIHVNFLDTCHQTLQWKVDAINCGDEGASKYYVRIMACF